jgi:hypothetical protein
MANAIEIHGTAFRIGSVTCLARIVGANGDPVIRSDIASIVYTVYTLDHDHARTPVQGHASVSLVVQELLFDTPQTDASWTADAIGYNFRHVLDVATHQAFASCGRYAIEYVLTPAVGQVILMRFIINVI